MRPSVVSVAEIGADVFEIDVAAAKYPLYLVLKPPQFVSPPCIYCIQWTSFLLDTM